jgi:hypothetical protein
MSFDRYNEILKENAGRVPFKDQTVEGDIILLILRNSLIWSVVHSIGEENDRGVREVIIKIMSVPPLPMYLNLTEEQLDGIDPFIIESNEAYMKAIDFSKAYSPIEMNEFYNEFHGDKEADIETDEDGNIIVTGSNTLN